MFCTVQDCCIFPHRVFVFLVVVKTHTDYFPKQINTLRTGDADLRFYITTVQDG